MEVEVKVLRQFCKYACYTKVHFVDLDWFAEWILIGKEPARKLIADHQYLRRLGSILHTECPAAKQRNTHRLEVIGRRDANLGARFVAILGFRAAVHGEGEGESGVRKRQSE